MHKQRVAIIFSSLLGVAGYFLPWINMPQVGDISGTVGTNTWVIPALFGLTLFITFLGDRFVFMNLDQLIVAVAPALIAGYLGVKRIINIEAIVEKNLGSNPELREMFKDTFSVGFGLYLIVGGAACVLLSALLIRKKVDF